MGGHYRNALRLSVRLSIAFHVRAVTYLRIGGLSNNMEKRCAVTLIWVKVTQDILCSECTCWPVWAIHVTYLCIDGLPFNLVQHVVFIETMCSDLDLCQYLKDQGHIRHLKVQSTHACVCSITFVCIDEIPNNLIQMLFSLRRCAVTLTCVNTLKVKVTQDI